MTRRLSVRVLDPRVPMCGLVRLVREILLSMLVVPLCCAIMWLLLDVVLLVLLVEICRVRSFGHILGTVRRRVRIGLVRLPTAAVLPVPPLVLRWLLTPIPVALTAFVPSLCRRVVGGCRGTLWAPVSAPFVCPLPGVRVRVHVQCLRVAFRGLIGKWRVRLVATAGGQ